MDCPASHLHLSRLGQPTGDRLGRIKLWHTVTLALNGREGSETARPSPLASLTEQSVHPVWHGRCRSRTVHGQRSPAERAAGLGITPPRRESRSPFAIARSDGGLEPSCNRRLVRAAPAETVPNPPRGFRASPQRMKQRGVFPTVSVSWLALTISNEADSLVPWLQQRPSHLFQRNSNGRCTRYRSAKLPASLTEG